MTLQERLNTARELHRQGYNCSQSVALAFSDVTEPSISRETLAAVTSAFGGGVGGCGEICGAISGMAAIAGIAGFNGPVDKRRVYASTSDMLEQFRDLNHSVLCRELRVPGRKSCMQLIEDAVSILHNSLDKK